MTFDFTGKKILITGAGRGLGRHLAIEISKAGGEVFALGRNKDNLDSLAQEAGRIHVILADLNDWDETRAVVEELETMDGVVNNAGVANPFIESLEVPKEIIERTLNVNLMAAINIIQLTGKKMKAAGKGGSIVNVSSVVGINPMKHSMAYNVSKAALDMVTKQFALELGSHQIRVNSVNPTVIMTDMGIENWSEPERAERFKSLTPMRRFCEIQECVEPIMYFLSGCSKMVTGTINPIEGGLISSIAI